MRHLLGRSIVLGSAAAILIGGHSLLGAAEAPSPKAAPQGAEARFAEAMEPIDGLMRAWAFGAAGQALAKLSFEEKALADRLATRRVEAALLGKLEAKIVAKIESANPRLRKSTVLIPGLNGDLVKADGEGLTAELSNGQTEAIPWKLLTARSARRLAQLATDRTDPNDGLACAVLALLYRDTAGAENDFAEAKSLGAHVERHVVPLAEGALAKAAALAEQRQFADAAAALLDLETSYGWTPWFAEHREAIAALRGRAAGGSAEAEAEKLYAQAVPLFEAKDYFELKPLVEKLKADFAGTRVVADAGRKPSIADLAAATAKLGKTLTVRRDGKGDYKTVQAAIDAAPPKSAILIGDPGPYHEVLKIPKGKDELLIRGKKGCWPVITSERFPLEIAKFLVDIESSGVTLDGLVLSHAANKEIGGRFDVIYAQATPLRLHRCILSMAWDGGTPVLIYDGPRDLSLAVEFDHCLIGTQGSTCWGQGGTIVVTNSLWLQGVLSAPVEEKDLRKCERLFKLDNSVIRNVTGTSPCEARHCTFPLGAFLSQANCTFTDCILGPVIFYVRGPKLDHCNVFGDPPYREFAQPGKACLSQPPAFASPMRFDYRLRPGSPCRKRASDGTDLGCHYTPFMVELYQKAMELSAKGVIKLEHRKFGNTTVE